MIGYGNNKCKAFACLNNGYVKLKKGYAYEDGAYKKIYSAGNIVTYMVDSGVSYQEEVDEGVSCLSPKTFTPSKSGWTFAGWREDKTANGNVLTNKVMGDAPVTLYAVFKQDVTMTLYNGSASPTPHYFSRYYNNAQILNPTYKIPQVGKSGWTAKGWSTSAEANGGIVYANNATITIDKNISLYGRYDQNVTLSFWDGTKTVTQTHTRLYNSSGKTFNPTVAIWQQAVSGWNAIGFSTSSAANGGITNTNGAVITMDGNKTFYARYNRTLTCRFDGGGATGGGTATASGTQDRGNNGATTSVRITMPQCGYSRSGYSFRGWSYSSQVLQPGASVTITDSTYATATWQMSGTFIIQNGQHVYGGGNLKHDLWSTHSNSQYNITISRADGGGYIGYKFERHDDKGGSSPVFQTNKITGLGNFSQIHIEYEADLQKDNVSYNVWSHAYLSFTPDWPQWGYVLDTSRMVFNLFTANNSSYASISRREYHADISNITGDMVLVLTLETGSAISNIKIYNLWLS